MLDATLGSTGFNHMKFVIQEINDRYAYGIDGFGREVKVPMTVQPSKAPLPAAGETWIIEKSSGAWTFSKILYPPAVPVVTGSVSDGSALTSLLEALDTAGIIVNNTTS